MIGNRSNNCLSAWVYARHKLSELRVMSVDSSSLDELLSQQAEQECSMIIPMETTCCHKCFGPGFFRLWNISTCVISWASLRGQTQVSASLGFICRHLTHMWKAVYTLLFRGPLLLCTLFHEIMCEICHFYYQCSNFDVLI